MDSRRMIYPYTLAAKMAHFPFKFYYQNNPFFRFWLYAVLVSSPIFYKIQTLTRSPGNYQKLEEYLQKQEREHQQHLEHLI